MYLHHLSVKLVFGDDKPALLPAFHHSGGRLLLEPSAEYYSRIFFNIHRPRGRHRSALQQAEPIHDVPCPVPAPVRSILFLFPFITPKSTPVSCSLARSPPKGASDINLCPGASFDVLRHASKGRISKLEGLC